MFNLQHPRFLQDQITGGETLLTDISGRHICSQEHKKSGLQLKRQDEDVS